MGKEAYDDYKRYLRDKEANSQRYLILQRHTSGVDTTPEDAYLSRHVNTRSAPSSTIRVGDLVHLEKNQRVPADMVLLHTSESSGTCFIRTDQLDGETDWKLRVAISETQKMQEADLLKLDAEIYGQCPPLVCRYMLIAGSQSRRTHQGHSHICWYIHTQQAADINP